MMSDNKCVGCGVLLSEPIDYCNECKKKKDERRFGLDIDKISEVCYQAILKEFIIQYPHKASYDNWEISAEIEEV